MHIHLSVVVDAKSDCGTEMSKALLVILDEGGIGCSWQDCTPCAFSQLVHPDEGDASGREILVSHDSPQPCGKGASLSARASAIGCGGLAGLV